MRIAGAITVLRGNVVVVVVVVVEVDRVLAVHHLVCGNAVTALELVDVMVYLTEVFNQKVYTWRNYSS